MSRIRADEYSDRLGTGAPTFTEGVNVTGVITATSFSGDGSGLTGVGVGTEDNINTSGIVTASKFVGAEFEGSGDKLIFSPTVTSFSPTDGATDVALSTDIILTFNQPIYAGVGSIFLRNSSGIGTEIEAIGITSSMISNQTLTINPTSSLPITTDVYVVLPQGVITNAVAGVALSLTTYNFTTVNFELLSTNPSAGATDVSVGAGITLTFNIPPTKGTGTVELKEGDPLTGTLIESFDAAASGQINISGNDWTLTPSSNLGYSTSIYPIIPDGAIVGYIGLNTTGADSYSFTTLQFPALGAAAEGGYVICKSGGTGWIVAPASTEVSRNWYSRGDAVTTANANAACGNWFVPSCGQIQNPGYVCRTYWDSYSSTCYWSSTEYNSHSAWEVNFSTGSANGASYNKTSARLVRAFRCVSY